MSEFKDKQCCEKVWGAGVWHTHQCKRKAVIEKDGKLYCKIHDPEYIKAKDKKKEAEYEENSCKGCGYHFLKDYYPYCPMCGEKRIKES